MNKFISILCPTNRGADINAKCVNLLLKKASNPNSIEFIFRIDHEDNLGEEWCDELISLIPKQYSDNVKVIEGPKHFGYCSNQDFGEEMYEQAEGEFLFFTNDDIDDISDDWDKEIERFRGKVCLLKTSNPFDEFDFPVIAKKWRDVNETFGHTAFIGYDCHFWDKYFPEIVNHTNIKVTHNPIAEMGVNTSSQQNCLVIQHPDYLRTKHQQLDGTYVDDHPDFGTREGEMRQSLRIKSIDVPKMKEWLRSNPEWQLNPEPWLEVEYKLQ